MPTFGLQPEGLLQKIFEEIGIGVTVIDRDERIAFANYTALKLMGITQIEDCPTFREWRQRYEIVDSAGQEMPREQWAVMRALQGEHVESQEVQLVSRDGSKKWLLTWAYPFSVVGLQGVLALVLDETVDVELRRAATQLERMETLGALAAGLTHTLNNLLETISLNVEFVLSETASSAPSRGRLNQISAAATKAAGMVNRLLQFGRSQEIRYRHIYINDIVAEVLHFISPLLRPNIVLRTALGERLPQIQGDPGQLEQALINLIVNALDAMPNGGELKISTASKGSPAPPNDGGAQEFVSISVSDTGHGIPQELQSVIFEPFFTTKPPGKGTGLGLSSVYGTVKQHNGAVNVYSTQGGGATFVITLPAQVAKSGIPPMEHIA